MSSCPRSALPSLAFLVAVAGGVNGCREPGADWVTTSASTSAPSGSTGGGNSGSAMSGSPTAATTAGGASTASATTAATGTGGSSTGGGATTDTADTSATTGDSTDGSGGTTGTGGSGGTGGSSGDSLITNGDFSSGESDWTFSGNGTVDASSGEYCVTFSDNGQLQVSWPSGVDPASISSGVDYQTSYQVYYTGSEAPSLTTKVGQAFEPYTAFVEEAVTVGTAPATETHTFSVQAEEQAGVLFTLDGASGVRVCFDNVALSAQ